MEAFHLGQDPRIVNVVVQTNELCQWVWFCGMGLVKKLASAQDAALILFILATLFNPEHICMPISHEMSAETDDRSLSLHVRARKPSKRMQYDVRSYSCADTS